MADTYTVVLTEKDLDHGYPYPLGQSCYTTRKGLPHINFALYSKWATGLSLLIFKKSNLDKPKYVISHLDFSIHKTERVWHVSIDAKLMPDHDKDPYLYGYRVEGPNNEVHGQYDWHTFDSSKIAVDPYARAVHFPKSYDVGAAIGPGDNIGKCALGVITEWEDHEASITNPKKHVPSPRVTTEHLVVYEMHVKGFTMNANSGVKPELRGTYAGLKEKIPYLKELGITAVEFLPIYQFDPHDNNYWGYQPLFFFAPHAQYAAATHIDKVCEEFGDMIDAFHEAGILVFLDVVYNHTGEGNHQGPKLSYKLIDNSTYYLITVDGNRQGWYLDYSGTGNTLHAKNITTRGMILASLRYWVERMRIDGFRFDLASVLALNTDGSTSSEPPIFAHISADPSLAGIHFIAEPWSGVYREDLQLLGAKFPGSFWQQWNSKYRDTIQKFVKGSAGIGDLAARIYGSEDLFHDNLFSAKKPQQSVNYIVSHDGFTLYDMVSYNHKTNHDGSDEASWNCGYEGATGAPPDVMKLRRRQVKNFITLMMVSKGTPMLKAGDEFCQTQYGNNNPYNQDNETTWMNWDRLKEFKDVHDYTVKIIKLRKKCRIFYALPFWRESVSFYGTTSKNVDWNPSNLAMAVYLDGTKSRSHSVYIMINSWWGDLNFTILEPGEWLRVADTFEDAPNDICHLSEAKKLNSNNYNVRQRSIAIMVRLEPEPAHA